MPHKRFLDPSQTLKVDFRNQLARPDYHRRFDYRGLSLEHTRVTSDAAYDFSWVGQNHYLALHDLVMEDGELDVEGLPALRQHGLRDTPTFCN